MIHELPYEVEIWRGITVSGFFETDGDAVLSITMPDGIAILRGKYECERDRMMYQLICEELEGPNGLLDFYAEQVWQTSDDRADMAADIAHDKRISATL